MSPRNRPHSRTRLKPGSGWNPVAAAVADQEMRSVLRDLRLHVLLADDGAQTRELLAHLAMVLGMAAEVAVHLDKDAPQTRRLHSALRAVIQMSTAGAFWDGAQRAAMETAVGMATSLLFEHKTLAFSFMSGAKELAQAIRNGTASHDAVAGAEIYLATPNTEAATAMTATSQRG